MFGIQEKTTGYLEIENDLSTEPIVYVSIYDILLFFIAITSAIAVVLIVFEKFDVPILIGTSMGLTITYVILCGVKIRFNDVRLIQTQVLLLIGLAIIFRLGSYTHFKGGQDQGLYVTMSKTLVANGGVNIYDHFRATLPDDLKAIYDNDGMLGIFLFDANKSIHQINFYPLNGVWLAIFGEIFGLGKHGYATQFFSLLIVVGVYLLTLELTENNKKASLIALLFAAANPAFVFFSKFPVTETLAMAFSVNGFYLLARGVKCDSGLERLLLLMASAMLLGMFNLVRMSFILFLPTIALIFIVFFLFPGLKGLRWTIFYFTLGVGLLYISSWLFYYYYQPRLANDLMVQVFQPFIEEGLPLFLIAIGLLLVLVFLLYKYGDWVNKIVLAITLKLQEISVWFLLLALLFSIAQVIELIRNGIFANGIVYIGAPEITNFRFSGIYTLMLLLSPFSFALLIFSPFLRIYFSRIQLILVQAIIVIWVALDLTGYSVVAYRYYFARYVTSEILLYGIILVSIILSIMIERNGKYKIVAKLIVAATALYFCFFSSVQIGRAETEDTQMYYKLNDIVASNDVLVSSLPPHITFPMKYYFMKNVFQFGSVESPTGAELLSQLNESSTFDEVYLLTAETYDGRYEMYNLERVGEYDYKINFFSDYAHGVPFANVKPVSVLQFFLPLRYVEESSIVYLYKLKGDFGLVDISRELFIDCKAGGNLGYYAVQGFSVNEPTHTWTDGKTAILRFSIINSELLNNDLRFDMNVKGFTSLVPYQQVTIYANSKKVYEGKIGGEYSIVSFSIPVALVKGADNLEIIFDLPDASASDIDNRELGLSFSNIIIAPEK